MYYIQKLFNYSMATISILLSFGVTSHDIQAEQVLALRSFSKVTVGSYASHDASQITSADLGSSHAHADYNPLSHTLSNTFGHQTPTVAPRRNSHHKQLKIELEEGGRHAFDNTNLPKLL